MQTILALDDSKDVLALRSYVFKAAGYQVKTFESARMALLSLLQAPVDLVLTDYEMPEMNGLEFARCCRQFGQLYPGVNCNRPYHSAPYDRGGGQDTRH